MGIPPLTLVSAAEEIAAEKYTPRFWIPFGNFLDDFYRRTDEERQMMIDGEPQAALNRPQAAMLAAAAHKLANDYNLNVPEWVWKPRYYLNDRPYFDAHAKGNLRLWYMYNSPTEFKHRNLFVDENILTRV